MKAIRLKRFKGFADSGWIELNKITLLFGMNSSGKTSVLNALLLLKQSLLNPALEVPVTFTFLADKRGVDLGNYEEVSYKHLKDHRKPIEIHLRLDLTPWLKDRVFPFPCNDITFTLQIAYNQARETNFILGYAITEDSGGEILALRRNPKNTTIESYSSLWFEQVNGAAIHTEWYNFLPVIKDIQYKDHPITHITEAIRECLVSSFRNLAHIGPLRTEVQRFYQFGGENPNEVGRLGEDTLKILYLDRLKERPAELADKVNRWLKNYGYRFEWANRNSFGGGFQLILKDLQSNVMVNVKDVGFGISQILPIIVQGYLNQSQLVIIEQPEIHLHPRAQADLADMLIDMQKIAGKQFLIETHSEHLLLRLRRRIAENALQEKLNPSHSNLIDSSRVSIHFVEKLKDESKVHALELNRTGEFENMPDSFYAFFSDDFEETLKITEASARLKLLQSREQAP